MKIIITFLLMVTFGASANQARLTQLQNQIYSAFIDGNVPLWERTITEMERYYASNAEPAVLYDLLLARYGYIAMMMEKDASVAKKQLDKAEEELEKLLSYRSYRSNAFAMQGAFLGFRISLRPVSAIMLGPRSYKAINEAVEADRQNPVAWMEMGNSRFYTPSAFGGSKQEALEHYSKSVELFERNIKPNQRWLYLNSLVGLAKSYQYTGRKADAIATYKKALTYEPGFKWVRDDLLPALLKN